MLRYDWWLFQQKKRRRMIIAKWSITAKEGMKKTWGDSGERKRINRGTRLHLFLIWWNSAKELSNCWVFGAKGGVKPGLRNKTVQITRWRREWRHDWFYTGWPRKPPGTAYVPQYVDAIIGISVWGNFSWENDTKITNKWMPFRLATVLSSNLLHFVSVHCYERVSGFKVNIY